MADVVTTTVEPLRSVIRDETGTVDAVVIPNAIFTEGWKATPMTGSPDGWKRIFWQGGETHGEDWMECDAYFDVTAAGVNCSDLREYETVFVQRIHDWDSYYMLERLKSSGKRIVYDMDDDVFHLDKENPAVRILGRDELMAAAACMRLVVS